MCAAVRAPSTLPIVRTTAGVGDGSVKSHATERETGDGLQVHTGPLWVSVHVDAGRVGVLEFPGPDQPVRFAGADLTRRLTLTVR